MNKLIMIASLFFLHFSSSNASESLTASCAACHGKNGISQHTDWPNLAGQQRDYLYSQLKAFKSGHRKKDIMPDGFLKNRNDTQLASIASYYSAKPPQSVTRNPGEFSAGRNVRAYCVACHGMNGNTVTSLWPNLAGQKQGYLYKTLMDYKSGKRKHPIMQVIANELSNQQIADVAKYYSQQ